jgi:hypothetical protein
MSGYRQLHTHLWSDSWFVELEPDLKLLFIYLFSNERASVCGLYELPIRTISFETGLGREEVRRALELFDQAGKARYDFATGVVWVRNMLKYQGTASPKVQARIQADIRSVPDCALKQQFLDTLSIPYRSSSDSSSLISSIDIVKQPELGAQSPVADSQKAAGAEAARQPLPRSPAEAMLHPDLQVFSEVTGGHIPGLSQYQTVIETLRFLRLREKLEDAALREYLAPYWIAWSGRKRLDGRPYDPGNITWLVEWALNRAIPPPGGPKSGGPAHPAVPTPEQTRRMLDERDEKAKHAVPMPEDLRRKMHGLKEKLASKDGP